MPRDAQQQADGDTQFMGIAPRLDPGSLPPGMASEARNMRFRNGVAATRRGVYKPSWVNNLTPEIDNKVRPFGEIHGVGVFRNPDTNLEFVVIAADGKAHYTRQGNNPIQLGLPGAPLDTLLNGSISDADTTITVDSTGGYPATGTIEIEGESIPYTGLTSTQFTGCSRGGSAVAHGDNVTVSPANSATLLTGEVTFTQAFNKLMMFRGGDFPPLVMTDEETGFVDLVEQWDLNTTYAVDDEVAFGPLVSVSGIAHSGGTATATTSAAHGYVTGADVTIAGANESEFNGRFSITKTSDTTFTYTGGTGASATGTITSTNNKDYYQCTVITSAGESPSTTSSSWSQLSTIMPNATHGVHIANRIVVPTKFDASSTAYGNKQDFVAVSDSLDNVHTYFDQLFRINFGSNSEIQDLVVFDEQRLIILKDKDVHMVTGFIPTGTNATLSSSCSVQPVVQGYGVPNRGASVVVGGNVYFYASRRGVVSLAQTEQSKVRGVDLPLSEPIQPLINRIKNESKVRIAYWDNKLWLACGIDVAGQTADNNALLVFDFLNQSWVSHDQGNTISPKEFFVADYNGSQRLFYIGSDGFINLIEENWEGDDEADLTKEDGLKNVEIESYLLTRGYGQPGLDHKNYRTATVNVSTWNPKYTIKAKPDGVEESQTLCTDRTKSRTAYYRPFDAAPFELSNRDDDASSPYREDYSVTLDVDIDCILAESGDTITNESGESILQEASVDGYSLGTSGVQLSRMQQTLEPFALTPTMGRYTQLELTNSQGRIEVTQAHLTSNQGDRTITVKS